MLQTYKVYNSEFGYEPFIDFLKGLAIMGVIWLHSMPFQDRMLAPLWCGMSVSLFLMVQVFHSYRRGAVESRFPCVTNLWKRILLPMVIATAILCLVHWRMGILKCHDDFYKILKDGGIGPGCYYPWIYIQFAFLLPLVGSLQRWIPRRWGVMVLLFSVLVEIACAYYHIPPKIWRLLLIRYFILIWLGHDVVTNGIRLTPFLIMLSLLSMAFILWMYYVYTDCEPLFVHNSLWKLEHWPAYFYPAYLLLYLLRAVYERIPDLIRKIVNMVGRSSYEVFLCQMCYFDVLGHFSKTLFGGKSINSTILLIFPWLISVGAGVLIHHCFSKPYKKTCRQALWMVTRD